MKTLLFWRHALNAACGLATGLLAACGGGGDAPETVPQSAVAPEARASALAVSRPGELASYVQERLRQREAAGQAQAPGSVVLMGAAGAAAAATPPRSGTTVQEGGVDEPDLLQGAGEHFFALRSTDTDTRLQVFLRDSAGVAQPLASLVLPADDAANVTPSGMVLGSGQHTAAVLSQRWHRTDDGGVICADICPASASMVMPIFMRSSVTVQMLDLANPAAPAVGERFSIDGQLVASRRVGDTLVVATSYIPRLPLDALPAGASAAERSAAIARTTSADLLPRLRRNGGATAPLLADTDCWTQVGNGSSDVRVTTISLFDLRTPSAAPRSRCILGGTEALYMTPDSLYLATSRWTYSVPASGGAVAYPSEMKTDIHRFTLGESGLSYRATGTVKGHLGWHPELKPYRFSEWQGDLRVLSFTGSLGWFNPTDATNPVAPAPSPATLTVLRERSSDQTLQPVATLPNAQRPEAIGKPGEQVYAVRFVGPRGYVVTFRTIDPLYVLDLANAADPRIAGSLEVPGVSDQLFPLADGLLLGVGRDTDAQGRLSGPKVSLFDTLDPARPRQVDSVSFSGIGFTGLDSSPHALNWLAVNGVARIALPTMLLPPAAANWQQSLQRFEVDLTARTLRHKPAAGVLPPGVFSTLGNDRSLQIGNQLYHLRDGLLHTYDW